MQALDFWKIITMDKSNLLERFIHRSQPREILGLALPVASREDVLRGKVWAAQDPDRRGNKRQKDIADIARLLEAFPETRSLVPQEVLTHLL